MAQHATIARYINHYVALHFERRDLFRTLTRTWPITTALYPGSFIHITPSLTIPHVVYVDRHPLAIDFFRDQHAILDYIAQHKDYPQSTYLRFLAQDYTRPLALPPASFDLLIALYAPHSLAACVSYLRNGGLVLTHGQQHARGEASDIPNLTLCASIRYQGSKYRLTPPAPDTNRRPHHPPRSSAMRFTNNGMVYREREVYAVYQKTSR